MFLYIIFIGEHPQGNCVALADGTIALLSSTEEYGELVWGVANDYNQLLLPYPAIGCASMYWGCSRHEQAKPHVVCCLRGGSCYVIPFVANTEEEDENDDNSDSSANAAITVFTLDTDTHAKYVQGFTAGNLIISSPPSDSSSKSADDHATAATAAAGNVHTDSTQTPVLIYGWAGGLIDVYSCDLMMSTPTESCGCRPMIGHREVSALEDLVSNGSTALLVKLLASLNDKESLLQQPMWREAWEESRRESNSSLELATAKDLVLPKWRATRSLLLSLSTNAHKLGDASNRKSNTKGRQEGTNDKE